MTSEAAHKQLEELIAERDALKGQVEEAKTEAQKLGYHGEHLPSVLRDQDSVINSLKEQVEQMNADLGTIRSFVMPKTGLNGLVERIQEVQREASAATKRAEEAEAKTKDWRETCTGLRRALANEESRRDSLTARVRELEAELLEWQTIGADVKTQKEIVTLRDQLGEVRRDNQRLHSLLAQFSSNA